MGRVGASVIGQRATSLALPVSRREIRQRENLIKNASRIVSTLGEMKGAAMKVGQMLSLYEGMLPAEVSRVLEALQREAPRVPAEVMRYELENALGAGVDEVFADFEDEAFAAASIGQVHRGRLHDGREVAVKIQYPLIDEIVRADLKNLKRMLGSLFGMLFEVDFEPIWGEMRDRLLEELDYGHEAENIRQMIQLHEGVDDVVIPRVIEEASGRNVLTMERVEGIKPDDACSERWPAELRDRWGQTLFDFLMRGLFEHRQLHADPNLANFAFLDDGRVVVYDFGCVKRVPQALAAGYAALLMAVLEDRRADVPAALMAMGLHMKGPKPVPLDLVEPYIELLGEIFRREPTYRFGENPALWEELFELGMANWAHSMDMRFSQDVVFVDRALAGHFGNLIRLRASGPWRDIAERYAAGQV